MVTTVCYLITLALMYLPFMISAMEVVMVAMSKAARLWKTLPTASQMLDLY
jgi:hypothetical protein